MKNEKLIKSFFAPRSVGATAEIIGLVAGLAAGVVLGVLFAPGSGKSVRSRVYNAAKGLIGHTEEEQEPVAEIETPVQENKKKPKSDIKELVHKAHAAASHTEQEIYK